MTRYGGTWLLSAAALGLATWTGCEKKATPPPAKPPAGAAPGGPVSESDRAALRSFVNDAAGGGAPAPGVPAATPDLKFDAPAEWRAQPPSSAMRRAQYALPRAAGDSEDGELVVFFFGAGEGGNVQDNLARWKGQFTTADAKPLPPEASKTDMLEANGMKVTLLDVSGRYAPSPMGGAPATAPRDSYRMFAAVIEAPGGSWFVRSTGPAATMAQHQAAIRAFVTSARR